MERNHYNLAYRYLKVSQLHTIPPPSFVKIIAVSETWVELLDFII